MKRFSQIAFVMLFIAVAALSANAQAPGANQPRATPPQSSSSSSVAIINTDAFSVPKTGIARLNSAVEMVGREFKARGDEIQRLRSQLDQLIKEIETLRNNPNQAATVATKVDQAKTIENNIKRKGEDAQRDYLKRLREATAPITKDVNTALQAYARQRGISVILDASKMGEAMMVINNSVDITAAFIADYNGRNPAAPATGATPARP